MGALLFFHTLFKPLFKASKSPRRPEALPRSSATAPNRANGG